MRALRYLPADGVFSSARADDEYAHLVPLLFKRDCSVSLYRFSYDARLDAGHGAFEPGTTAALLRATEQFRRDGTL